MSRGAGDLRRGLAGLTEGETPEHTGLTVPLDQVYQPPESSAFWLGTEAHHVSPVLKPQKLGDWPPDLVSRAARRREHAPAPWFHQFQHSADSEQDNGEHLQSPCVAASQDSLRPKPSDVQDDSRGPSQ
jgi:hypothetical protein